jgi:hypothetical protein
VDGIMSWLKNLLRRWTGAEAEAQRVKQLLEEAEQRLKNLEEPRATETKQPDGTLEVTGWNHAYVRDLRTRLPSDLTNGKTDSEVVQLWVDRYNHEHVEPKLEVLHSGIEADGRIKMKLEWNTAFVRLLQERGIAGDTEEKMVENYLAMMTRKVDADLYEEGEGEALTPNPRLPEEHEIERELEGMDPEVVRRMEKVIRRRAQKRPLTRAELKPARNRSLDT